MSSLTKKTSELDPVASLAAGDRVLAVTTSSANTQTVTVDVSDFLANTNLPHKPAQLVVRDTTVAPANSTSMVVEKGRVWFDANYVYVATANNVVKRAALSTF